MSKKETLDKLLVDVCHILALVLRYESHMFIAEIMPDRVSLPACWTCTDATLLLAILSFMRLEDQYIQINKVSQVVS